MLVAEIGLFIRDAHRALAQPRQLGLALRGRFGAEQLIVEPVDLAQLAIELRHAALERRLGLPLFRELLVDRRVRDAERRTLRSERAPPLIEFLARGLAFHAQLAQLFREARALIRQPRLLALVGVDLVHFRLRLRIELGLLPAEQTQRGLRLRQVAPGEDHPQPEPLAAQLAGDLPQPWLEVVHLVV